MKRRRSWLLMVTLLLVITGFGAAVLAQTYGEAPMLAEQVERGALPPVEERLPVDPYVVEPIEQIGQYGGTLRVATQRPDAWGEDSMLMSLFNALVQPHPETSEIRPHFARQVDTSDDFSTYTIYFREGVRWSDGEPFTTEDIMFWYEDILQDPDLNPVVPLAWRYGDEVAQVEALDDYTIRVTFAGPSPFFLQRLVHLSGNAAPVQPKHYLQQYHPRYVDEAELNQRVQAAGFENWFQLFNARNLRNINAPQVVGLPTINSYMMVEKTSERRVFERNPYYWKVDTEGNQLPYIDRIETRIVANREIMNGMLISGDVDFAGFETEIRNYPLYRRFEDEHNYRVLLWNKGTGSDVIYQLNMTHEDPVLREIFQDVRFRRALSLAINRDEIVEEIYFGQAAPSQYTVLDISRYYKPEYEQAYAEYDLEQARALLDEMGLEMNGGQWVRPDNGEPITFTIEYFDSETPKSPNVELVTEYWNELGLNVSSRPVSGELQTQRAPANLMDATIWHGDKATDILFPIAAQFFVPIAPGWEIASWTEWARWFNTGGREGEEPPDEMKELRGWWDEMLISPSQERIDELGDKILASQAENLWVIGTVGRTPHPVVFRNTIGNVPETGFWVWDMLWSAAWDPEQFFIRQ